MSSRYDVVVLGAGPGGYVAAVRAAQLGKSVAVIEKQYWGGTCLNIGCIPSKALLRNAELAHVLTREAATFGISGEVSMDYGVAFDRSRTVADGRAKGVHFLMRKNGIREYDGVGTFTGPHAIDVALADGTVETIEFAHAIIATGATPRVPAGIELGPRVVTYETLILSRELPRSIVIVGAGAIGIEFAYVLANYGVEVTMVEFLGRALPNEDAEVSAEIARRYRDLGVRILTSTRVDGIRDHGDRVTVDVTAADGTASTLTADRALIAIGFAPRIDGYGLETTGVALTDRGAIAIDETMRTSVDHLFAIGDVTAKLQLAHVAEAQGVVAAETIAGAETMPLGDYRMMPRATFCQPQVASFGLTEEQARAERREVRVAKFPFVANGKAQGLGERAGFAKLVVDAEYGELLGAHLVGADVSELLPELTLAQKWDLGVAELARNVHVHPTLGEALQETFHGALGHMINL